MIRIFIVFIACLYPLLSSAADHCSGVFASSLEMDRVNSLLNRNRLQEAYWLLRSKKNDSQANVVRELIMARLEALDNIDFKLSDWSIVGVSDTDPMTGIEYMRGTNANNSFSQVFDGYRVFLKFSEDSRDEEVGSLIADLLAVKAPFVKNVQVGGEDASVQLYLEEAPTYVEFVSSYITEVKRGKFKEDFFEIRKAIPQDIFLFRDMLNLKDQNGGNFLVMQPESALQKPDEVDNLFVSIDHEGGLENLSISLSLWQWGSADEPLPMPDENIAPVLIEMRDSYPTTHSRLLSPEVGTKIVDLLENYGYTQLQINWVREWLESYKEYSERILGN